MCLIYCDIVGIIAAAAAADLPPRKALLNALQHNSAGPKQTESTRAKRTREVPAHLMSDPDWAAGPMVPGRERTRARTRRRLVTCLRIADPDWPWPIPLSKMRLPMPMLIKEYREASHFNRSHGITEPTDEERAEYRDWRKRNGYGSR